MFESEDHSIKVPGFLYNDTSGVHMSDMTDLDCKIYVDTNIGRSQLVEKVAQLLEGSVEKNTVRSLGVEIDVLENEEFDESRRTEFPDGFLRFRYSLEFYFNPSQKPHDRVTTAARILELLWSDGFPAVAACDYEAELPKMGGYKNGSVPWPKHSH